jgi:hypothetical protein
MFEVSMTNTMQGRRIPSPFTAGGGLIAGWPEPGDYWFYPEVGWQATVPDGRMATLTAHTVVEHEDGTITVSPSILIRGGRQTVQGPWHGYLERGIWRTV